jgi:hypothetical protein
MSTKGLRIVVTTALIASAGLFAIGVAIERNSKHQERRGEPHAALGGRLLFAADEHPGKTRGETTTENPGAGKTAPPKSKAKPPAEGNAGQRETGPEVGHTPGESPVQLANEQKTERVFGIDIESTGLVLAAVAVSLLFAVVLWLSGSIAVPLALAGFALVAAVFDVREVFHQIDESRTNLTVIAAIVATLHVAVVAGALSLARRASGGPARAGAP